MTDSVLARYILDSTRHRKREVEDGETLSRIAKQ